MLVGLFACSPSYHTCLPVLVVLMHVSSPRGDPGTAMLGS